MTWLLGALLSFSGLAERALAQNGGLENPIGVTTSFESVAAAIIDFIFTIAIPITAIMVLVGAFQMITSGGNPEQFSKGKKTLLYAAIGFVVVIIAKGVVSIIKSLIGVRG